jgi:catechol 2,3-dioxygenase-like lactoylglutathione lyase family enzyme
MLPSNQERSSAVVSGLDLLFLEVNSLEESIAFYDEQLGFELESHNSDSDPPMATLRGGALRITLVQQLETMLKRGRGVHFVIGVSDVAAYHRRLQDCGLVVGAPKDEGWGGRFITVQDPDGYRLFFVTWEKGRSPTVREG